MPLERYLIFLPAPSSVGNWHPTQFPFEDVWIDTPDGVKLHGWYVPCDHAKGAVLFCHGNGGNITHRTQLLQMLHQKVGVSLLAFDYRGYGRSNGTPSETGVYTDARAARAWLAAREKIPEQEVIMMGESLGGGVAVDLAANDGARALVLICTFNNLPDVAAYHFPLIPVRWLMHSRFDSENKIRRYHGPLFQTHGDIDTVVPYASGRKLFEAANQPKEFLLMPGHNHNDSLPQSLFDSLSAFIKALP